MKNSHRTVNEEELNISSIYDKLESGEPITDADLIRFRDALHEALDACENLGPRFLLATRELNRTLSNVKQLIFNRFYD